MDVLTIGGFAPDVDVISIQRTASILDGENAGRLKNGDMSRDIIGTYYNYGFEIKPKRSKLVDYDRLYQMVTAPVESYLMEVPFAQGKLLYDAYVSDVTDELFFMDDRQKLWDGMGFTATAIGPQRRFGEKGSVGFGSGNQVFTIDGVGFNVSVTSLKRTGSVLDTSASGRLMDGVMTREIIGTYYNYSMTVDARMESIGEYDDLFYVLSAPIDSHRMKFPYGSGNLEFNAYISNVSDELRIRKNGLNLWSNLAVDFVAMSPERKS